MRAGPREKPRQQLPTGWSIPTGVVAGAGVGLIVGILLEQLVNGLILGSAVGLLAGSSATAIGVRGEDRRGAVLAVAIALLVTGMVAVV